MRQHYAQVTQSLACKLRKAGSRTPALDHFASFSTTAVRNGAQEAGQ